jgi:hypothetical protein
MRKIVICAMAMVAILLNSVNVNAQLFKKLKEKINNAAGTGNQQSEAPNNIKEEKAGKVLNTYTIKGKYNNMDLDITENDDLIYDTRTKLGGLVQYLRVGKKQIVVTNITFDESNQPIKGEKAVVNKSQFAKVAKALQSNGFIGIELFFNTDAIIKRLNVGETENNLDETFIQLFTSSVAKANAIQAKIFDKEIGGDKLNTFAYLTGDGTLITTTAPSLWGYRDGALYFESVDAEKALRVTYVEINKDMVYHKASYTVKVTKIPASSIGNYKDIKVSKTEALLPLTNTVTKVIYKDQEKATSENIQNNFKMTANDYNADLTNRYFSIVAKQLGADAAKFKKEIQDPIIAARIKEEKDFEEKYYTKSVPSAQSSSNNTSSSSNSASSKKAKTDVRVRLVNESDRKIDVRYQAPRATAQGRFSINSRSSAEQEFRVGSAILVNGITVLTITEAMDGTRQIIMR